jgi:hypothetical protein
LPFLRVLRDKRGYETTYLMHWFREGSRQRSRILYVFRTPPGVRVGREALDADTVRELEAQHPAIEWDWNALVENQQMVETSAEPRRTKKRRRADDQDSAKAAVEQGQSESGRPPDPGPRPPRPARPAIPSAIEGETPDEQMAFLARWHEEIRARIQHRTSDPARLEALFALAERLNPAAWTDADQITNGLQQAGEALERLSHVFSKRRRRARKTRGGGQAAENPKSANPKSQLDPNSQLPNKSQSPNRDVD